MGREFELKYRADPEKLDTIRQKFSGFTSFTMVTAYYDTPERTLRQRPGFPSSLKNILKKK